ncbi:MAG: hypothetical protein IAF94_05230 [Pirellulaceae bacterium]|nr:hypothetical protein [Pirellulaceae bacterium]
MANSPYDLGEGAPAQYGSDLAINSAPNMIGDLLSSGGYILLSSSDELSNIPIAGGDRRFKISENMSPLPRDRVYYAFNGFQQAARTVDGREIDVNRHTFGAEKTFLDRTASVEFRMPVIQGASAVQSFDFNQQNDDGVEFGNMTIIPKLILSEGDSHIVSAGLGINLPTARAGALTFTGNLAQPFLTISNQSVHLSPFLGLLLLPGSNTYIISFAQVDFDTAGNNVTDGAGNHLGVYQDQNLFHFDVTVGRFLYRDDNARLTGIAAQFEVHYTSTLQDSDEINFGGGEIFNPHNRLDLLTLTGGLNFQFWNTSWLTVGCAVPVRGSQYDSFYGIHPEHPFDAEVQVFFNRYF